MFLVPKNSLAGLPEGRPPRSGKELSRPLTLDQEAGSAPLPRTHPAPTASPVGLRLRGVISPTPKNPETRAWGDCPLPIWTEPHDPTFRRWIATKDCPWILQAEEAVWPDRRRRRTKSAPSATISD